MTTTIIHHIERDGRELELRVTGDVEPPEPGICYGPPERCIEPHDGYAEITHVRHVATRGLLRLWWVLAEFDPAALTDAERRAIEEELMEQRREDDGDAAIDAAEAAEARMDR